MLIHKKKSMVSVAFNLPMHNIGHNENTPKVVLSLEKKHLTGTREKKKNDGTRECGK